MEDIPQLIPVNNNSEKPQESINIGDILEGEMILAGQSGSTGTKHKILVTHKISDTRFIGDHSGLVFEMDVKGANNEYFSLSIVHTHPRVNMYYGTFHVESIKKPLVAVVKDYGNRMASSLGLREINFPDISISDELITTREVPETFARIDTTKLAVDKTIMNGYDKDPSRVEESLTYLGNLQPGRKITGTILRQNKAEEPIEYSINRIGLTSISLTRIVYNPKTQEHKTKKYLLTDIRLIRDDYAIGTIISRDGKEKGGFLFSIEAFQPKTSALASSVNWVVQKLRRT